MRVAIAEDAVLLREGLTRLLGDEGFDVVGQCGDADELANRGVFVHASSLESV